MFKNSSINSKLIISVLVVFLITLCVSYIALVWYSQQIEKDTNKYFVQNLQVLAKEKIKNKTYVGLSNAVSIANDDKIKEALKSNNRDLAVESLKNLSENLKNFTPFKNTKVHIHTKNNISFVRSWKLDRFGDDLSGFRDSIVHVNNTATVISTFEIGKVGLSLRSVIPIVDNETHLGSLEFIQGLNFVAKSFDKTGDAFLLLMDKKVSNVESFEEDKLFQENYIISQKFINQDFLADAKDIDIKELIKNAQYKTQKYLYTYSDIKDFQGKRLGITIIASPTEKVNIAVRSAQELINIFMFILVSLMLLILSILIVIINRIIIKPLGEFQVGLNMFFEYLKDPTKKVKKIRVTTNDEIAHMAKGTNESIQVSMAMHGEMSNLMHQMDKNVITSETDEEGIITYVSEAFCKISGFSKEELLGQAHSVVKHADTPTDVFENIWNSIKENNIWQGEIKNRKKDGGFYWVYTIISPKCTQSGASCGYTAIRYDITDKKEAESLKANLEKQVQMQTKDIKRQLRIVKMGERKQIELGNMVAKQKEFVQVLLDSQEQLIITTDGESLKSANETFFDFFAVDSVEEFMKVYDAKCVCDTFNINAPEGYLQIAMGKESWIDYVISRSFGSIHKVMISMGETNFIFSVSATKLPGEEGIKSAVFTNITEMENAKQEVEAIHKHTRESIEYASLIQGALIPEARIFEQFFEDHFAIWNPKDIVGGDIYLMHQVNDNELIIMVIDCTGHGVPGAFVTMLVKAIERQLMANIHRDKTVSPAKILSIFNKSIKNLLKQETIDSVSNAGFDGGIIYYNKEEKIIKFSGAETALFYIEENELKTIKGSRHSVGYKKSDASFEFKEHTINVKEGMSFYCTTDGYIDQNGGEKSFPFGKKRFQKIIKEYCLREMKMQKEVFLNELKKYQGSEETNDDVTLLGFKI